jgi:transcriptional regulator with GAF, ATPase, and Fis domain
LQLKDILLDDNRYLQQELHRQAGEEIIGANFGLKHVMGKVDQVASLATPVLLLGETGVGKEVIATAIHKMSKRKNGPLIKVNCGAIPDSLMDSELFGHEKGAFTGAVSQKRGRFERADGGTIFLDEIGELTPGAQIRLLRVLQDKEIERVGGTVSIPLNIRVIAATHRNLEDMLSDKTFREDLFFRLNVFPIVIPPLRDRRVDIPLLIQYFITKKSHEMGFAKIPVASQEFIERLLTYKWPGNVRELQNTIEHALIASKNKPIIFDNFDEVEYRSKAQGPTKAFQPLEQLLAQHIREALGITGGKVGGKKGAAKLLNMNPSTLRSKMMKLNIPFGRKA